MTQAYIDMGNLDRLMVQAYSDTAVDDDEYLIDNDSRQITNDEYEPIDLFEGEAFEDIMAVEAKLCRLAYFEDPFEVILDSGAGEHVASDKDAPGYSVVASRGSRAGQNFVAAGGHKMRNKGEMGLKLRTRDGRSIDTTFQVADVTRPLWSVARICDAGFKVVFTSSGAEVLSKTGKVLCKFDRVGNLYKPKLDLNNPLHEDFARRDRTP